jgi:orotate phosphoribosyltransferase
MTQPSSKHAFIQFALDCGALKFGEFKTKAGRLSPYFFNSGAFSDGKSLAALTGFYADAALKSGVEFDMVFGPAYKGITLGAGMAMALAAAGKNVPFAFNRKEAKDHGEGGLIVGAPLAGKVIIVDDVITDGASKIESVAMIRAAGAAPAAVIIALDRCERGADLNNPLSAAQSFSKTVGVPVISVANVDDIADYIRATSDKLEILRKIEVYRNQYGAN